ncbi:MAG: ATP synthase F1 subunit epsilon [Fimbriimonadaceae bacterium]
MVAPDRTVFEDEVRSAVFPAVYGYFGIWSNHEPMLVALKPGIISYVDAQGQDHFVSVSGGFLETSGTGAIVLAQDAVRSEEIDLAEAEAQLEEARKVLRGESSSMTLNDAMHEFEKATSRRELAKRR